MFETTVRKCGLHDVCVCVEVSSHVPARHVRVLLPATVARCTHDHAWLANTAPRDIRLQDGCRVARLIRLLLLLIPAVDTHTHTHRDMCSLYQLFFRVFLGVTVLTLPCNLDVYVHMCDV